jgi:hypothetical protein
MFLNQNCPTPYAWDKTNGLCVCDSDNLDPNDGITPISNAAIAKVECDEDHANGMEWN